MSGTTTPTTKTTDQQTTLTQISTTTYSDATVTLVDLSFDGNGVEMGFFFILSLLGVFLLMDRLDGRIFRLKIYLLNRDFQLITNPKIKQGITMFIRAMTWFSILMPAFALLVWSAGLIAKAISMKEKATGGICVFLTGCALACLLANFFRLKWNNYTFDIRNGIYFALIFLFLTGYQFVAVFVPEQKTVFGLNAVFLAANCLVMMMIVFFNSAVTSGSIDDLITNMVPVGTAPRDPNREKDFQDEVDAEKLNKEYQPSQLDIFDIFTIGKPEYRQKWVATSFGPGVQNFFGSLQAKTKRIVTVSLWCLATGILVVYSFVMKSKFPEKGDLGFITMIAILTTDVLVYFIQNASIVKTATPLCLTLFLNRFLLIIFGGDNWVYGYIAIYLFYGIFLTTIMAKRRFPFDDADKNFDIDQFAEEQKALKLGSPDKVSSVAPEQPQGNQAKAMVGNAMNKLQNMEDKVQQKFKLLTQPEHPLMIITVIYIIILVILTLVKPKRVPLPALTVNSRDLHFFVAWAFTIVIIFAYFTSLAVIRLFIRRKQGTTQRVYYEFKQCLTFKNLRIERYWVFIILNMMGLVAIGIISWWVTTSWIACVLVIFVDLYLLCMMNFYTHYIANDYEILQNIEEVNMKVNQHNLRLDNLKKEIVNVKNQVASGQSNAIGQNLMERAKTMIEKKKENSPTKQDVPKVQPDSGSNAFETKPTSGSNNVHPMPQKGNNETAGGNAQVNIRVQPEKTEQDKLIEEEIQKMGEQQDRKAPAKAKQTDGIYEGGEPEEITEIFVDPDEEEQVDAKKTRVRYLKVEDWRLTSNFFSAFWKGKLRKNDYQVIFSQILGLIVLVIGAWLICSSDKSYIGITIFVPFLHYSLAAFSQMKTLNSDANMNIFEYICFFLAYFVQYGWGIFNLYLTYGLFRKEGTKTIMKTEDAGTYIVVNLIVIPFITSCIAAILKWIDTKGKMNRFLMVQLIMTLIQGIAMLVCAFIFMTWVQGIVVSCVIGVLIYVGFQVQIYVKNEYYMPRVWVIVNFITVIVAVLAAFVASLIAPGFTIFLGFSISTWLLCFLLFCFGFGRVMVDYINLRKRPVFFSPWIFPIYRYDPKKQDVRRDNLPAGCLIASIVIMIGWSVLATVWFAPTHVGVSLSIILEMILLLTLIFLVQVSHLQLKKVSTLVDDKIFRRAWLEAKATYVSSKNAITRADLVTYEEQIRRRNLFRNKMRLQQGRTTLNLEEKFEGIALIPQVNDSDMSSWLNTSRVNLQDELSCYSYLFNIEKDTKAAYKSELELIIMLQILIIQYTEVFADQKKKYLFNFLIEKRAILLALDIVINIPPISSPTVQYAKVATQIRDLSPEKQEMFYDLREQFIQEQRALDDKRREAAQIEEDKAKEREKNNAENQKRKQEGIKSNDVSKPVSEWTDCWEKYVKIMEDFKKTGQRFTDTQFKADASSLGEKCQNRGVEKWIRASQHPDKKCVLYKNKVSALDVKQGALGDCYFLSAISVLGDTNVVEMIKTKEDEWQKSGCFCVRFYADGKEEFVIVDDYFPVANQGGKMEWAFVSGSDNGEEIWPLVLEKAYAKHYGDYSSIEAGKVHYALADMVKGFPEQLDLKKDAKNLDVFWEKMKALKRQGALIGAGSPENPMGDAAINQLGIVQGHAYSVLGIEEIDDSKLIQLRNPHGATGAEWNGDWSDTSANWNQRAKNKLNYQPKDHEDGVFWMDAYDFLQQFSYLYICRILNAQSGWKGIDIDGAWKGETAEGLPGSKNPSARLELNPQYSMTIKKPCDAFIMLKQNEPDTATNSIFKGKQSIFFMVSKNDGKRTKKLDKDAVVCRSGNPINLKTVSCECHFDSSISYPYTFSLMVANTNHGAEGEGTYSLSVYSTDQAMEVKLMA